MTTVRNLSVDRSANLNIEITVVDSNGFAVNLSGYSHVAYYKTHVAAANSVVMSTAGYANGLLTVSLTGEQTSNAALGRYMYEVYITDIFTDEISRVQEGILTFTGGLS